MKRLILIDSHAIIHRAYHALPPLSSSTGEPVNAVYGFTSMLMKTLKDLKPDYIAAAFDMAGPTFRHVAFERYKAHRPETPSDLIVQFGLVRNVLEAFGITRLEKQGFEADDIIGTAVKKFSKEKNLEIVIVTGDMDALQLVGPHVKVFSMRKGLSDTVTYDEAAVRERYGFGPDKLVDYKGLRGDPSDNIPGVKGIGEKTAGDLIKTFGSIDAIYKALKKNDKKISASVAEKLKAGEEDAMMSRELSRINADVPVEADLGTLEWHDGTTSPDIRIMLQKFGFTSLVKRLDGNGSAKLITRGGGEKPGKQKTAPPALQGALLDTAPAGAVPEIKTARSVADIKRKGRTGLVLLSGALYFFCEEPRETWQISEDVLTKKDAKEFFSGGTFVTHDAKALVHFFRTHGTELGAVVFDMMLASYVTSAAGRDFSFEAVAAREGFFSTGDPKNVLPNFFDIVRALEVRLNEGKLREILNGMEIPVSRVLAGMEERGILIDKKFLSVLSKKFEKELSAITKDVYKMAGEEFNIASSQQLSRILFEKLGVKTHGLKKTEKGGVISTRESELLKLKEGNPIIGRVLEYRELAKLKNTYIDVLPDLTDKEGRIHTTFNLTVAATGRLSSSDPNLQNIPILSEYGREIRKAFIAGKGFVLASFDYSQIELRVAAHIANDAKMIDAFKKGVDIHALTASNIYGVALDKVTPKLRRRAKTLNFGVLYGMGPQTFAAATKMSLDEARDFIGKYFKEFSGIRDYIESTKQFVEERGYVETIFGRRRYIPEIHSQNWQIKREAERMAVNMPIQGTATGDIVKIAMIRLDEWIRKEKLEGDVRMLLQVHDELVFELKEATAKKYASKVKEIMEGAASLKVPLVVDVKMGESWSK